MCTICWFFRAVNINCKQQPLQVCHRCCLYMLLQALDPAKYPLPEPYPYKEAAAFFKDPDVTPADQLPPLKWTAPDEDALVAFLVGECQELCLGAR